MSPDDPRHGTTAGAKQHRKHGEETCPPCKAAATLYQNQRELDRMNGQPRAVSAVGVARRLQALMHLGYTYPDLAPLLGVSTAQVHKWARGWQTITRASTRNRVAEVFDRLCMSPVPDGRNARYARTVARRNGWVSPLAWDDIDDLYEQPDLGGTNDTALDPVVVHRLLAGEKVPSTPVEKAEALRQWTAAGRSARSLEDIHGWKQGRYYRQGEAA